MKKKILYVITKSNWGGAQRYVYDLATNLPPEYEPVVALGGNGALTEKLHARGIRTIPLTRLARDVDTNNDVRAFFELIRVLKEERPDIVHLNSSKAGALGALASRIVGIRRIIFTAHGWAFNEPVSLFSKAFRWTASLATILLSNRVITVSHFDNIHSPLGLTTDMIHNGIAETVFDDKNTARDYLTTNTKVRSDTHIVGTIAELHKNKGLDILIHAFREVAGAHLVIIGEGEERKKLEHLIQELGMQDRIHLLGFIENAQRLLKAFDVFVLPSRKEGLPYVILEAGSAGVPVVASIVGGIPEIIDDQLSGILVPAYDTEALTEALTMLVNNPRTRERYAE